MEAPESLVQQQHTIKLDRFCFFYSHFARDLRTNHRRYATGENMLELTMLDKSKVQF